MVKKATPAKVKANGNGVRVEEKILSAKKAGGNKKQEKAPKKTLPPKVVEEYEEEDDSEEESDAEVPEDEEQDSDEEDAELENQEDDDDDDDDEEEDDEEEQINSSAKEVSTGNEDDEDDEDDDEEDDDDEEEDKPEEAPISKKSTKDGEKKVNTGNVPADIPNEQVVYVKDLPPKSKLSEIIDAFSKFGPINTVKLLLSKNPELPKAALVAFEKVASANKALKADGQFKVGGKNISITPRKANQVQQQRDQKKRTVYVKKLKAGTTEEQLREHFADCGAIEKVTVITRQSSTFAFILFELESAAVAALKLHSTLLNGMTIHVQIDSDKNPTVNVPKDPERTVLVKNSPQLEDVSAEKIIEIFSKCGEIDTSDFLRSKVVLAFITFKQPKAATKALNMDGTTVEKLQFNVEKFNPGNNRTKNTIFVLNVKPADNVEQNLRDLFSSCGEIENVVNKGGYALVRFANQDAFCKSFLLNESIVNGQMIFLEPYSEKKQLVLKQHKSGPKAGPKSGPRKPFDLKRKAPPAQYGRTGDHFVQKKKFKPQ